MSKYNKLWEWIKNNMSENFSLFFDDIDKIVGFPIDHSFLSCKKELVEFGYNVQKISMKNKMVYFEKL